MRGVLLLLEEFLKNKRTAREKESERKRKLSPLFSHKTHLKFWGVPQVFIISVLEQIWSEIQQSRPVCVCVFRLLDAGWLFQARFTSIWCNRSVYVCLWHYHLMSDSRCISFCVLYVCVFNLWRNVWKIIFANLCCQRFCSLFRIQCWWSWFQERKCTHPQAIQDNFSSSDLEKLHNLLNNRSSVLNGGPNSW